MVIWGPIRKRERVEVRPCQISVLQMSAYSAEEGLHDDRIICIHGQERKNLLCNIYPVYCHVCLTNLATVWAQQLSRLFGEFQEGRWFFPSHWYFSMSPGVSMQDDKKMTKLKEWWNRNRAVGTDLICQTRLQRFFHVSVSFMFGEKEKQHNFTGEANNILFSEES